MKIHIIFTPLYCNGNMDFYVEVNGNTVYQWHSELPSAIQEAEFNVNNIDANEPFCISLGTSGKNQTTDTLIENGEIVADKAIQINSIFVNGQNITDYLFLGEFVTDNGMTVVKTKYFGFNGQMNLDIGPTLMIWIHDCTNKLSLQLPSFEDFLKEIMS